MPDPTKPIGDTACERLREYAEAYGRYRRIACQVPADHSHRQDARLYLDDLECALIGELTANAGHAEVERRAVELFELAGVLRAKAEGLLDALSRVSAENGPGSTSTEPGGAHEVDETPARGPEREEAAGESRAKSRPAPDAAGDVRTGTSGGAT